MFKGFLGVATNTQILKNHTNKKCDVKIVVNSKTFECSLEPAEVKTLDVKREEIGEITAIATIIFSNGQIVDFTFRVSPKDCIDDVIIKEEFVYYNGSKRGNIFKLAPTNNINNVDEKYNKLFIEYTELNNLYKQLLEKGEIEKLDLVKKFETEKYMIGKTLNLKIENLEEKILQLNKVNDQYLKDLEEIKYIKSEHNKNIEILQNSLTEKDSKYNEQLNINNKNKNTIKIQNDQINLLKSEHNKNIEILQNSLTEKDSKYNEQLNINNENKNIIKTQEHQINLLKSELLNINQKFNTFLNEHNNLNSKYSS